MAMKTVTYLHNEERSVLCEITYKHQIYTLHDKQTTSAHLTLQQCNEVFGSATDPIPLAILFLFLGATSSEQAPGSVTSNETGIKFSTIVLQVNTHRLTTSDF